MISATAWIRKGAAASVPERFEMTEEQYSDILSRAKFEIAEAKESLQLARGQQVKEKPMEDVDMDVEDELAKFNLEGYSEEEDMSEDDILQAMSNIDDAALGVEEDPYLKGVNVDEEENEEDRDDLIIQPTDNLLIACRTEDEVSYLETYVYEEEDDNLYVHHDIMLPAFPLCVEWIGAPLAGGQMDRGNFAAVGTFDSEIEIWNLDILEVPYPATVLGQRPEGSIKKSNKPGKKKSTISKKADVHTDAVMCMSWNRLHRNLLLSGSADSTIKLWDLKEAKALRSFEHHSDKVQSLQWNPVDASVLVSAAYDRKAMTFDCRVADKVMSWNLLADPECLKWNPHDSRCFIVSDEDGRVQYFDTRKGSNSEALFTLAAHSKAVTSVDWNPALPNCLLTVSVDKTFKLWNTLGEITCVASREAGVGKIFTGSFCFDTPNLVAIAGGKGVLSVFNLLSDVALVEAFKSQSS